uniref:PX domain-containing protein n=2 Tax=Globodera pallida TaxID=36090 RepID=A0A183CFM9_GLOPA
MKFYPGYRRTIEILDLINRNFTLNVVDQLPLPPGFDQLPERELKKARAIFGDRNLSFREKDRKVFEFVKTLSPHLRRFVRPPLPPVFARLRSDTQSKIGDLLDDDSLDDSQRQKRFWELANGLADDEKATLGEVLKFAPA